MDELRIRDVPTDPFVPGAYEALVATGAYMDTGTPRAWCMIERIKEGDGSPYPVVVRLPNGAQGQFKFHEVFGVRMSEAGATYYEVKEMMDRQDAARR